MKTRFTKVFIGFFAGVVLLFGANMGVAQASGLSQSQIQSIMGLLQSFSVDQATLNNVYAALTGAAVDPNPNPNPGPGQCLQFMYNLSYGMTDAQTGGEVSELQSYLGLQPTGYFGNYTRQYVMRFQQQHGIAQVGQVGPQTRAALGQATCGGYTPPSSSIYFTLSTPFSVSVGQTVTESSLRQLSLALTSISNSSAQVTLTLGCAQGTQCFYAPTQNTSLTVGQPIQFQGYTIVLNSTSYSSATFTVTSTQLPPSSSLSASPTSGQAPLTVTFTGARPCGTGSYELDYGDGQYDVISGPGSCGQFSQTHTYLSAGTYTASFSSYIGCLHSTPACMIAQPAPIASVTIQVSGQSQAGAPTISSIVPSQGPTGTQVTIYGTGFTNDNTVRFGSGGQQHVPSYNGTSLTYTIPTQVGPCDVTPSGQICAMYLQQVTPGSYNVSVSNAYGTSNTTSFTVTSGQSVGGVSVTSPTAGQVYTRGQDMTISWSYPVTPNSTNMALDLYTSAGSKVGTIAFSNQTIGSYTWHIPGYPQNYMCTMQYPNGLCGVSIPSGQYYVRVSAIGSTMDTSVTPIASGQSGVFTINLQ